MTLITIYRRRRVEKKKNTKKKSDYQILLAIQKEYKNAREISN